MSPRDVSGRYRGRRHGFEVQLRVDVDGPRRPMNRVSADYYRISGNGTTYAGSMRVDAPVVKDNGTQVTITGPGVFSLPTKCKRVKITIPRVPLGSRPAAATLAHLAAPGDPGAAYPCAFESASFRTVELEEAREAGVPPIEAYDTGSLPARCAPRRLTPIEAFSDAGIDMQSTGPMAVIDTADAGVNDTWSDAELHAAMEQHFSRFGNRPRWAIWLLHAASHDDELIQGLMFDQRGLQRQGCAVFYGRTPVDGARTRRRRLHTCVHELGHGFNLPHVWEKPWIEPPIPSRPDAASWMNYPERFPGGEAAYWPAFDFGFDDVELGHLRHGFEQDVIMGGRPFGGGAARRSVPGWDADGRQDPGLRLNLLAPNALVQEVPVTVRLELSATGRRERAVPPVLGPRAGTVDIAIRGPSGDEFVFEPLLRHCRGDLTTTIRAGEPPLRDWAFIHYGRKGFAFDRPGQYLVRARYTAPGAPSVLSNVSAVRVMAPRSRVDLQIAQIIGRDEQVGTLMSLLGSGAPELQRGNDKLSEIAARYPTHSVGAVARLVQAASLAHGFKRLDADGAVSVSAPRREEAMALVADLIDVPTEMLAPGTAVDGVSGGRPPAGSSPPIRVRPGIDSAVGGFVNSRGPDVTRAVGRTQTSRTRQIAPPEQPSGPPAGRPIPTRPGEGRTGVVARRTAQAKPDPTAT